LYREKGIWYRERGFWYREREFGIERGDLV